LNRAEDGKAQAGVYSLPVWDGKTEILV